MKITIPEGHSLSRITYLRPRANGNGSEVAAFVNVDSESFGMGTEPENGVLLKTSAPVHKAQFIANFAARYSDCALCLEVIAGDVALVYGPGAHPAFTVDLERQG